MFFDSPFASPSGTGRRATLDKGWASEPDSTPKGNSGKLKGGPPSPAPRRKQVLPNRLPDSITVLELRELCGNSDFPEDKRLALLVVSMWLSRQPTASSIQARRKAAAMGTEVCQGTKNAEQLVPLCFPSEAAEMVIQKVKAMLTICTASLVPEVKDLALSHVSSKCGLSAECIEIAAAYAERLKRERPNAATFNAPNAFETWWPNFP